MLDYELVREITLKFSNEVRKIFNPCAILLFGSYANGTPHEYSDIDVAIVINDSINLDWHEYHKANMRLFEIAKPIHKSIEPHLLDAANDPMRFLAHVLDTGEYIYKS